MFKKKPHTTSLKKPFEDFNSHIVARILVADQWSGTRNNLIQKF